MARYLDIATDIAQRVRSGDLPPGAELPAVRTYAAELGATSSTIVRAYRHLADARVITVADRRRARVATGAQVAAARLLEADRVFRLAGSDDPALQILLAHTTSAVTPVGARGSFHALRALARGEADGAAIHLRHRNGDYNAPFARALLHDHNPHLLHLWRREQGLLVPRRNPRNLNSPADLAGLLVARREQGAGTRVLLDQLLIAHNIPPHTITGPELNSHLEIALAIAAGTADTGLGIRAHTAELELGFIPLTWESYDIALPESALGVAQPLRTALRNPTVRTTIANLGGYDLTHAGELRKISGP
ncbi:MULTISPECIES: helix-turn-helix transcriptional regulator [unclassified Amycolatopsis]|uniref:helix-turn-helix transcriptional regulator n=1 Tax=unclassified Amycolatopsis TaxID=2618356 RepID=UPI001C6A32A8|nr:helix-turn-helix transcriptional regulator [Amycolatopsis sp. DSM 110486]QYN19006.1 helix-turn-helix transcriptional regulator [Amycolatopsis sp. DSM 110486]